MSFLSKLPLSYDKDYILAKVEEAGVDNHFGIDEVDGEWHFRYLTKDVDAAQAVLDAYQVSYADDVLRARLKEQVTADRWSRMQVGSFMGQPLLTDDSTITRITAAIVLMKEVPESPQQRRWKNGPNEDDWVTVDLETLLAMGAAIGNHVQDCFNNEEALLKTLNEATTVDELMAIDLSAGWPE